MIVLYQFAPSLGRLNPSPFCLKLEAWLRLTGLPYRIERIYDLKAAPKGKAPYIDDGEERIGDSALIIAHLRRSRGIDPDAGLTPAQRGVGRAVEAMLEDRLWFVGLHFRWMEPASWPVLRDEMLAGLPAEVAEAIRSSQRDRLRAQGMGVHRPDEIYAIADADITALADILGTQPFLFGDRPASADCTAFAILHSLLSERFEGAPRQSILSRPSLVDYERRMRERLFPETLDSHRSAA
jgi:glutathione S-transferase